MSRTVIVLGAGASYEAGGPLMANFIKLADDIRRNGNADWAADDFELAFRARGMLQRAAIKAKLPIDNMEHVFAAFEMAELLNGLGDLPACDVKRLIAAMRNLITRTLEHTMLWPVYESEFLSPPTPYDTFAEFVSRLHTHKLYGPVSIAAFNYDLALDYSLVNAGLQVDYCLTDTRPTSKDNVIPVQKLHGSLNWTISGDVVNAIPIVRVRREELGLGFPCRPHRASLSDILHHSSLFDKTAFVPEIIPPTWSKGQHHRRLFNVWRNAATSLQDAENIIIIGYSLPETDQFFRHFFALSTIGDTVVNRFWVVDPAAVANRFKQIVGPGISERESFKHYHSSFGAGIVTMAGELGMPRKKLMAMLNRAELMKKESLLSMSALTEHNYTIASAN